MIRIIKGATGIELPELAEVHWKMINPTTETGEYRIDESLIDRLKKKIKKHEHLKDTPELNFYLQLADNDYSFLKKIIITDINKMDDLIEEIRIILHKHNLLLNDNEFIPGFRDELDEVFAYNNWRSNGKAFDLFQHLNFEICPYCNMEKIQIDYDKDIIVAHFDHYYLRAHHPYLALSFFNLIPSCEKCNKIYKLEKPFTLKTHIHPYIDDYNELCYMECDLITLNEYEINIFRWDENDERSKRFNNELSFTARYNHRALTTVAKTIVKAMETRFSYDQRMNMVNSFDIPMEEVVQQTCEILNIPISRDEILNSEYGKLRRDIGIQTLLLPRN